MKRVIVRVSQFDLNRGIQGDTCPILRAMQRAARRSRALPPTGKLTNAQWALVTPFKFELRLRPQKGANQ